MAGAGDMDGLDDDFSLLLSLPTRVYDLGDSSDEEEAPVRYFVSDGEAADAESQYECGENDEDDDDEQEVVIIDDGEVKEAQEVIEIEDEQEIALNKAAEEAREHETYFRPVVEDDAEAAEEHDDEARRLDADETADSVGESGSASSPPAQATPGADVDRAEERGTQNVPASPPAGARAGQHGAFFTPGGGARAAAPVPSAMKPGREGRAAFNVAVIKARKCEGEGELAAAVAHYQAALGIWDGAPKLASKIAKLERLISRRRATLDRVRRASIALGRSAGAEEGAAEGASGECGDGWRREADGSYALAEHPAFRTAVYPRLLPYQREGVRWLMALHARAPGGILGDDMGLGKTCQTVAFLGALLAGGLARRALVVAPVSVLAVWSGEFAKFSDVRPLLFHGASAAQRDKALRRVARRGGVLLTSYGLITTQADALGAVEWDYLVCDEGHRLKNPSIKLSKRIKEIPAAHRLLLTGTPLQNKLEELWALFEFCCPGLLGDRAAFANGPARIITDGSLKEADGAAREAGTRASRKLLAAIAPYYLARSKDLVFGGAGAPGAPGAGAAAAAGRGAAGAEAAPALTARKTDWIVWLSLTALQEHAYRQFLDSDAVHSALNSSKSPLTAILVLKKICDHPYLLQPPGAGGWGGDAEGAAEEGEEGAEGAEEGAGAGAGAGAGSGEVRRLLETWQRDEHAAPPAGEAAAPLRADASTAALRGAAYASAKTLFLLNLLQDLGARGHKTLVFSQSARMLRILRATTRAAGVHSLLLDGSVKRAADREAIVRNFNDPGCAERVLFLTTGVGGVGITLTGADRVVMYDPSWNPATDAQAIDRAFRVGQTRDVVVYRLVTCGTVEEKILRNQIFKKGLQRAVLQRETQRRHFSKQDLRALFKVGALAASETHAQVQAALAAAPPLPAALAAHCGALLGAGRARAVSDYHALLAALENAEAEASGGAGGSALAAESPLVPTPARAHAHWRGGTGAGNSDGPDSPLISPIPRRHAVPAPTPPAAPLEPFSSAAEEARAESPAAGSIEENGSNGGEGEGEGAAAECGASSEGEGGGSARASPRVEAPAALRDGGGPAGAEYGRLVREAQKLAAAGAGEAALLALLRALDLSAHDARLHPRLVQAARSLAAILPPGALE